MASYCASASQAIYSATQYQNQLFADFGLLQADWNAAWYQAILEFGNPANFPIAQMLELMATLTQMGIVAAEIAKLEVELTVMAADYQANCMQGGGGDYWEGDGPECTGDWYEIWYDDGTGTYTYWGVHYVTTCRAT